MKGIYFSLLFILMSLGCTAQSTRPATEVKQNSGASTSDSSANGAIPPSNTAETTDLSTETDTAEITNVEVSGNDGNYTLAVTIASPDTGCDAYANWWEVITPEGTLLYRRILAHSHINEQPFTRSGGPVTTDANQTIIVRMHMHPTGYSPLAMQGTIDQELVPTTLPPDFAADLAKADPQPNGCAF